jgi:hypothetical protein
MTEMPEETTSGMGRRTFVKRAGAAALAAGMSAKSYGRVLGANDRIRLGQLGCGDRSEGHVHMVHLAAKQTAVETVAVCDLWTLAREHRAENSCGIIVVSGSEIGASNVSSDANRMGTLDEGKCIRYLVIGLSHFKHSRIVHSICHWRFCIFRA